MIGKYECANYIVMMMNQEHPWFVFRHPKLGED